MSNKSLGDLFHGNPSRDYQPDYRNRNLSVNMPFMSEDDIDALRKRREREGLLRDICKVFDISIPAVIDATRKNTGEKYISFQGMEDVAGPFPAIISHIKATKGKGKQISMGSFLNDPLINKTLLEFYASTDFSYNAKPVLMVGELPWFKGRFAITNLPLELDCYCFQIALPLSRAKKKVNESPGEESEDIKKVTFGSLTYILYAMRRQNVWVPLE